MIGWPFKLGTTTTDRRRNAKMLTSDNLFEVRRKERITVEQNAEGNLVVSWSDSLHPEVVYTGSSPEIIDVQTTIVFHYGLQKATIIGLDRSRRHFVTLFFHGGDKVLAGERILKLEGAHNFRDLGGYKTSDGRRVKWGKLYRSDHLGSLTEADRNYLQMLGIRQVYDLRTFAEANKNPDQLPSSINYSHLPIFAREPLDRGTIFFQRDHLYDVMFDMYRQGLDLGRSTCATIVRQLAENDNVPAVTHCSAGKDRTGLVSALVLLALGVPVETIIDDYTLTNLSSEHLINSVRKDIAQYHPFGLTAEHFYPLLAAPANLMKATLHCLSDQYGTVEDYLCGQGELKIEQLEQLRDNLLE